MKIMRKICITTVMNVLNFFQKGSSRSVLSLKSEKRGDFSYNKVLVLAKIGVIFLKKSVKRGIFSVRGTSMVTIKQRESDARGIRMTGILLVQRLMHIPLLYSFINI